MRKTLMSLTALAAIAGAGLLFEAKAAPVPATPHIQGATVQTVQYYYARPVDDWRWREHERWRRWHRWHHWHHWHHGW